MGPVVRCIIRKSPIPRSTVIFAGPKRIEDNGTKTGEVAIIARHERQAIGHSSRRQQAVDDRDRPDSAHASPLVGDRIVDAEHATVESGLDLPQPVFERRGLIRIPRARKLDPLADLPKNERAQKDVLVGDRSIPSRNTSVAALALSHLGDDVGIDQEAHRSTSRPRSGLRSKSIPSSGADASSSFRLTLGGSTKRCRRSMRAATWRAGSDKAAATWRTRLASSLLTLTSTRTKPRRA